MSILGIDIGGSSIKGAALINDQWVTAQSRMYADPDRETLVRCVRSVIEDLGVSCTRVGLCLPGRRSEDSQKIELSVNIPALNGWAFSEMFDAFGLDAPASVCSDAHAAGVDMVRSADLRGRSACISLGTGVGLGVFDDGFAIGIGSRGIGHLGMVEIDDGVSIESVVGIRALRDRFGDALESGVGSMDSHDPIIRTIIRMIRLVHAIYVPRHVVLMGGVGMALGQHQDTIVSGVQGGLPEVADADWELGFGSSLFHAATGAARIAHDEGASG